MEPVKMINKTMELSECRDQWSYDETYNCWCLEDILYTPTPTTPRYQRLSIFVPKDLLNADGTVPEEARKVPIVFANNSAGYMQMPHFWLDFPLCRGPEYLAHGLVYISVGCRGRESRDANGRLVKGPCALVDLKTAIRFLRHNRDVIPGDFDKIISTGWSAGGAMSSLLAVTGDNVNYLPYLQANGAFMDESDAIFAAQIYCPIVDLEHADFAYEWMFHADKTCEPSPNRPAETFSPFKDTLSGALARHYITYFNSLGLRSPDTNAPILLGEDGRSGSAYDYLMDKLNSSATEYLTRLEQGRLPFRYSAADYIRGSYTTLVPDPNPPKPKPGPRMGPMGPQGKKPAAPPSFGDMIVRPPKGVPFPDPRPRMVEGPGTAKPWLSWDGEKATVSDLDTYVLNHRRRKKTCTGFDQLEKDSGENQAFGTPDEDYVHYAPEIAGVIAELKEQFPAEYGKYYAPYAAVAQDAALAERVRLLNPLSFIGTEEKSNQAKHYRIRTGASDADTSLSVSMTLALKLHNAGCGSVDYALVWDQPHCEADYQGDILGWIDSITK